MLHVLNLKETGGLVPGGTVYIGRAMPRYRLRASKWQNPFRLPKNARREQREQAIAKFEVHLVESGLIDQIGELRGKHLACWCAPRPCHGDVLLKLANGVAKPGR
jgi:Domain of unknown function (DUF4326)